MVLRSKSVRYVARALLVALILGIASAAHSAGDYPLRPPDTSSPRATLQGFVDATDDLYRRMTTVMEHYADSGRLYMTSGEQRERVATLSKARESFRYLDLSNIPPVLRETVGVERLLQLREVLDRIEIPPFSDVPDQDAMARLPAKRWRLPNTEIDIVRIESGARAGEYLFAAGTIERLPEFYQRVKNLPYRPGPGEQLASVYRRLSHRGFATLYDAFVSSPIGLEFIVPPRWMLNLPGWAKARVAGATAWQWLGLAIGSVIGGLIILLANRAARKRSKVEGVARPHWRGLLPALAIVFVAGLLIPALDGLLRTGGNVRVIIEYARTGALYLSAAWLAIIGFAILGETIIGSERLNIPSLDNQLIRLGLRLAGVLAAVAILISGGDVLGFPAYSVLAGLGVGGLAVALAAQSTVANLIGSLLIVLEKPFRVGHYVRIGTSEGTVEDVGFRSTRIRTLENSLVSIPSSAVVNTTVENLSVRSRRRQRFLVQMTYDTSCEQLEEVIDGIGRALADDPLVDKNDCQVRFNNLAESSLDILVIFHLLVQDYASELMAREAILLKIMDCIKDAGAQFAFPTRTVYLGNPVQSLPSPGASEPLLGLVGADNRHLPKIRESSGQSQRVRSSDG
jgi:MscS family membrane protein